MSEFNDKVQNYIEENYPYIEPCMKCRYWRWLNGGGNFVKKDRFVRTSSSSGPACHYGIDNDYNRKLDFPCDGTCQYFKPRRGKKKKVDTMGGVHKSNEFKERGD